MRIGTLFSGIGAPEQAAIRVYGDDLKMVFACEWDKFARQSFTAIYDFDGEHFHKDINDMNGKQYAEQVDIIIGGSPCQDFSIAGLREGVEGKRGSLIWQYFRIIDEVRPPIFIYENVKGMLSDRKINKKDKFGQTFGEFLEVFKSIGYYCQWKVLNTKDYGVPQNRERVFIVGFLDNEAYYRFQFAPKMPLTKRLKDVLESEVNEKYYLNYRFIETSLAHKERHEERGNGFAFEPKTEDDICGCIQTRYGTRQTDTYINEGVVGMLDIKGNDQIRRVYGTDGSAPCLQTMQGGNREPKILQYGRGFNNGGLHEISPTLTINSWQENNHIIEPKVVWTEPQIYDDYNDNLKTDGLACTLTTNCGASAKGNGHKVIEPKIQVIGNIYQSGHEAGNVYNKEGIAACVKCNGPRPNSKNEAQKIIENYRIRKLTPLECWRLQDFPDEAHEKAKAVGVSDSQRYKQAGNSITVVVMEMILREVRNATI